jgi:D-ribose pyranase
MLKTGILNPQLNSLLSRIRHTNTVIIADGGFPFCPMIETVEISPVGDVPTVVQVLEAIRPNFSIGKAWMAREFQRYNNYSVGNLFAKAIHGISLRYESQVGFKRRVPSAVGLICTGDTTRHTNIILESASSFYNSAMNAPTNEPKAASAGLFRATDRKNLVVTFVLVSSLFLLWGFCNGLPRVFVVPLICFGFVVFCGTNRRRFARMGTTVQIVNLKPEFHAK